MFTSEIDSCSEQQWNDLLPLFADANLYQTWSFGASSWGEKQLSHLVLREGSEPVAAAQVRLVTVPVLGRGVAYVRWGPLWRRQGRPERPEILQAVTAALHREYSERRRLVLRVIPNVFRGEAWGEEVAQAWQSHGLTLVGDAPAYRTFRVDLAPSLEEIRKAFDGKWRNMLNGAERNGLEIVESAEDSAYEGFLEIYQEMMARKQFDTSVDVHEFRRIQARLPAALKLRIYLARKEGRTLNALLVSALGDTAIYLLGATSDEGMKSKGSYLLHWRAIQWFKERGIRWYDLGGINPDTNPGVFHFKRGFSGKDVSHLGRFEVRNHWLSSVVVGAAERWKTARPKRPATPKPAPATH